MKNSSQLNDELHQKSGFTLVELAIVIVVIGLLAGGVLAGQELIEQAKIRAFLSQIRQYDTAVNTFRAKYGSDSIPGDFKDAAKFALNHSPDNPSVPNTLQTGYGENDQFGSPTDGNGDGLVCGENDQHSCSQGFVYGNDLYGEGINFWAHLSNIQLVKGEYGQDSQNLDYRKLPTSSLGGNIIALSNAVDSKLNYVAGLDMAIMNWWVDDAIPNYNPQLTPEQAYSIDSKIDDGNPRQGQIEFIGQGIYLYGTSPNNLLGGWDSGSNFSADYDTYYNGEPSCAATSGEEYRVAYKNKVCALRIKASN